jgi:hypothetical protein
LILIASAYVLAVAIWLLERDSYQTAPTDDYS